MPAASPQAEKTTARQDQAGQPRAYDRTGNGRDTSTVDGVKPDRKVTAALRKLHLATGIEM